MRAKPAVCGLFVLMPCALRPQSAAAEIKDLPSLEKLVSEIKEEVVDADDDLAADFKAEKISGETVVLNEEGKKIPLPGKK
jgi:hypothetical protein